MVAACSHRFTHLTLSIYLFIPRWAAKTGADKRVCGEDVGGGRWAMRGSAADERVPLQLRADPGRQRDGHPVRGAVVRADRATAAVAGRLKVVLKWIID